MKTLRIICFVCAAYYALHMGMLLFTGYMFRFMKGMIPETGQINDTILKLQAINGNLAIRFAPYLLIGIVLCLLMGLLMKPLWKLIPVVAVCLFAAGIIWAIAYYTRLQPYYHEMAGIMNGLPGMDRTFSRYMEGIMSISQYAGAYPVLVPGFLIFFFWWKSRKEKEKNQYYEPSI